MSKRNKVVEEIQIREGLEIEVSIGYEEGGMNYFSGNNSRRGFYAYVIEQEVNQCNGYKTKSFMMFGGNTFKMLLEETSRFNQKKLDVWATDYKSHIALQGAIQTVVDKARMKDLVKA